MDLVEKELYLKVIEIGNLDADMPMWLDVVILRVAYILSPVFSLYSIKLNFYPISKERWGGKQPYEHRQINTSSYTENI